MCHPVLAALFAGVLAAATAAQGTVCVTGRVVPVGGPTICQQGETHRLECTPVFLRSATIDLNQFNGQLVRIEGQDVGLLCTVLDVTQVTPALAQLTRCGSPSPGCPLRLRVCPGAIGRWWLFASFQPGFMPIDCLGMQVFADGSLLLGLPAVTLVANAPLGLCSELTFNIPSAPVLNGLQVWFQAARQDFGPVGPLQLSNAECVTLSPMVCTIPNC